VGAFLKFILLPITLLYSIGVRMRNFFYDWGIFSSRSFDIPILSVGNLRVGGTGKTPHTEFLIRLLSDYHPIASLSRGYGRKTKGFKMVDSGDSPLSVGDEPFQLFQKFPNLIVAVDEKRVRGINQLLKLPAPPKIIILDDAFQHRSVKVGMNILLTDYSNLYIHDLPLPSGRLRENKHAAKRADIIVVTKSPQVLSPLEFRRITDSLNPKPYQKVFFSYFKYKKMKPLNQAAREIEDQKNKLQKHAVLLVSAIANPQSILLYLKRYAKELESINFPDHHFFKDKDYAKIERKMGELLGQKKMIVMTEKDAVKFDSSKMQDVPVFALPIRVEFHQSQQEKFDHEIIEYVKTYSSIS